MELPCEGIHDIDENKTKSNQIKIKLQIYPNHVLSQLLAYCDMIGIYFSMGIKWWRPNPTNTKYKAKAMVLADF